MHDEAKLDLSRLFEVRQNSDYDDFYLISKEDVEEQLAMAETFVAEVEAFLVRQYQEQDAH